MKKQCEIKFITTQSKSNLSEGRTCYQGHLQHNATLSEKETRAAFAEYCGEMQSRTDRYLNALNEFIAQEIACGHRLNFGAFNVSLKMIGGFKSANAPFDETKNTIGVSLVSGRALKRAVKALKPINVTDETRWRITSTLQRLPYEIYDQLVAEEPRTFTVSGYIPEVHPEQDDEGIWIENDAGEKIATATITKSKFAYSDCTMEGSLPRGDLWMIAQCRYRDEPNLIRCRRRIKVV